MSLKVWTVMRGGPEGALGWTPETEQRVLAIFLRGSWHPLFPLGRPKRVQS